MKSIPYQALIRNWLAEEIKKEIFLYRTIMQQEPIRDYWLSDRLAAIQRQVFETLQQKTGDWEEQLNRKLDELRRDYEEKSTEITRELDESITELNRRLVELQEAMRQATSSEEMQALRQSAEELLAELQKQLAELGVQQQAPAPKTELEGEPAS